MAVLSLVGTVEVIHQIGINFKGLPLINPISKPLGPEGVETSVVSSRTGSSIRS